MRIRLVAVLIVVASSLARAEEPGLREGLESPEPETVSAQPCRPTIACMAEIVPAGFFEVEAGYGATQSGGLTHSGQLLLKYSLFDRLQLQVATNGLFLAGANLLPRAFDGVMPGLKWVVNSQGRFTPSNALSVHLMLPTHAFTEARQRTFDLQAWWYVSKDLAFMHADFNLMMNVFDLRGAPTPQGLASLALSFKLPRGFGLFTEAYSAFGNAQAVPLDGGSLNGVSFSPIDELVFDVGGDIGFYPGTRAFTLFAGVTFVPHRRAGAPLARARLPTGALAGRR